MARAPLTRVEWPHGYQTAAEAVSRRLQSRNPVDVYLSPDGLLWVRNASRFYRRPLPSKWHVGHYRPTVKPEQIEDDLIYRMKELCSAVRV